ncbi:MAG TPA: three-Cys-motif partner protein TcmP [Vicinamibacterales bacterium]|nr:three-Cys-motif partner protein TcmP [Vicinamibacterales bacterium]
MSSAGFHDKPFDEGTLTKLDIFELYTREWLPVFLAKADSRWAEIHIYDFFSGPGADSKGRPGSPLRLVRQLNTAARRYKGWASVATHLHLSDADPEATLRLKENLGTATVPEGVNLDVRAAEFSVALSDASKVLKRPNVAKLILIDQFGVGQVADDRFQSLVDYPSCDFLFFISSSILNRFHDHPAIKQKILRPNDHYHVHRAVLDYYRSLVPASLTYFLAPFSIKKGSNVYGIVFGSSSPLGIEKFLQVAWKKDELNGEADFDIDRNNFQMSLLRPTKVAAFEEELERGVREGAITDERGVLLMVFRHGVKRQHAAPVIKKLSNDFSFAFSVPQVDGFRSPRPILRRMGRLF